MKDEPTPETTRLKGFRFIGRLLASTLFGLFVAVILSLFAHFFIAGGFHPETIYTADAVIPLLAVVCGAALMSAWTKTSWKGGAIVGLVFVLIWFGAWSYLMARFDPALWWSQAILGLGWRHGFAWSVTLLVAAIGGVLGIQLRKQQRLWPLFVCVVLLILPVAMWIGFWLRSEEYSGREVRLNDSTTLQCEPVSRDGTVVRVLSFDLHQESELRFDIYDADSDDAVPWDDRNTTWLGQSIEFVLEKLRARSPETEVLCIINGGFFGAIGPRVAVHEAPMVINGKPLYNAKKLEEDWPEQAYIFGINQNAGRPQFHLERNVGWEQLGARFETALGGVRALRIGGQSLSLKPGMGGTTLLTSRTSIGWTQDSNQFFILIVRDPDGETASGQQRDAKTTQTGGWDVLQVQQFWKERGVPNAILFDGGESTQLVYRDANGQYQMTYSAYFVSKTLGYWRDRPLRGYLPMFPALNHGGVLNYLAISR